MDLILAAQILLLTSGSCIPTDTMIEWYRPRMMEMLKCQGYHLLSHGEHTWRFREIKKSRYVADARLFGVIKQKVFHFHFRLRRCVSNHTLNIGPMRNENNNSNASLIDRECLPRLHLICNTPQDMIGIMNIGGFTISLAEYDRSDSLSSLDTWGCQDYFIHVRFLLFH